MRRRRASGRKQMPGSSADEADVGAGMTKFAGACLARLRWTSSLIRFPSAGSFGPRAVPR